MAWKILNGSTKKSGHVIRAQGRPYRAQRGSELRPPYNKAIKEREIIRQLMNVVRTRLDSKGGTSYTSVI